MLLAVMVIDSQVVLMYRNCRSGCLQRKLGIATPVFMPGQLGVAPNALAVLLHRV